MEVSLYQFIKAYNKDLKTSNNKYYGMAIGEIYNVISNSFLSKSMKYMDDYVDNSDYNSWRRISVDFLKNLRGIVANNYHDSLSQIQYFKTRINISKQLLNGRKKLDIKFQFGIDKNNLIMLQFSSNYNLGLEASILKGLLMNFPIQDKLQVDVNKKDKLICWELSKGKEDVVDFRSVKPINRNVLIKTANRLTCL